MKTETYKGRKLKVRIGRGQDIGKLFITVNGHTWTSYGHDEERALAQLCRNIDFIDQDPVVDGGRWSAYWYAPGTYKMCSEDLHPVALNGECRHFTCVRKREDKAG